ITNVSHDIKTPLTSIISYVDLLKREKIDNPKAVEYINVLDEKSERLKQLIFDLIDASKVSTGNIELERVDMNLVELIRQVMGEYEDKFEEKNLELVDNITVDSAVINADGRRIFRVFDNLMGNVYKYAKEDTRVYLNLGMSENSDRVIVSIKNISSEMLNISAEELTERFVRGDKSRYTEGSGLGLSIARNLVELHGGTFKLNIDGDLFTVIVSFAVC
ncbi:MAG: HAMP domain-containing histidine kinase, partial [Eubacterium sp.]|nr:HAMP domain-containing histidine kinase [Eubacterium sp.]